MPSRLFRKLFKNLSQQATARRTLLRRVAGEGHRRLLLEPLEERRVLAVGDVIQSWTPSGMVGNSQYGSSIATDGIRTIVGSPFADAPGFSDAGSAQIYDNATGALVATLPNPTPGTFDLHGFSVAIAGPLAIVSSYLDDTLAPDSGSVSVFDSATGALLRTIHHPAPIGNEQFGFAIDASNTNGNWLLIGARLDNAGTPGGKAFLFDPTNGNLLTTISNPSAAAGDFFGMYVAVDGGTSVIGAPTNDTGASNSGAAYVFNAAGSRLATLANPTPEANDRFGESVDISSGEIVVGAFNHNGSRGAAYIFDTAGTLQQSIFNPTPDQADDFGRAVSIANGQVAVAAAADDATAINSGIVHLFSTSDGIRLLSVNNPSPAIGDQFGVGISLSPSKLAVGAAFDDLAGPDVGAAYLFQAASSQPTTRTWDGGDVDDSKWTSAENWVGNVAPAAGDHLVFTGSARRNNTNDFAPGVAFSSITFNASGFQLNGNAVALNSAGGVAIANATGVNSIQFPMTLASSATIAVTDQFGTLFLDSMAEIDTNGHLLTFDGIGSSVWSGRITGTGGLAVAKTGPGGLALRAANSYTGPTTISNGSLALQGGGTLGDGTNGTLVNSGATLDIGTTSIISETVTLVGAGHSPAGGPALRGTIDGAHLAGDVTLLGSTQIGIAQYGHSFAISGDIKDSGSGFGLTVQALLNQVIILSGDNDIAGPVTIAGGGGTLRLLSEGAVAGDDAVTLAAGTVLDLNGIDQTIGSLEGSGEVRLASNRVLTTGGNNGSTLFLGVISGEGGLTKAGTGTFTLAGNSANTYTRPTMVSEGTLALGKLPGSSAIGTNGLLQLGNGSGVDRLVLLAPHQIPDLTAFSISGSGTFDLGGFSESIGSLNGGGNIELGSGGVLTFGLNNFGPNQLNGAISGTGDIVKAGTGTFTLGGQSTFIGQTVVASGRLNINGSIASGATVNAGAVLGGRGTVGGQTTVLAGGTIAPGTSAGVFNVGTLVLERGSVLGIELNGAGSPGVNYDQLASTGGLTLSDAILQLTAGLSPLPGDRFVIVSKSGTDRINGRFQGLLNDQILSVGGRAFRISYEGGDGNDVELVAVDLAGRSVSFLTASSAVGESGGVFNVTAELSAPSGVDLTIPLTLSGTATAGVDYDSVRAELFFPAGSTHSTLQLPVRDDVRFEGVETVVISLQAFGGITVGSIDTHTLTISSNDAQPLVQFATRYLEAREGAIVEVAALLIGESELDVTVPLLYSGTASAADYVGPGSITIPAGGRSAARALTIINDPIGEPTERIMIALGTPTNATLASGEGAWLSQILTIPQNDAPTVEFVTSAARVDEAAGTRTLGIVLSHLSTEEVAVPFTVAGSAGTNDRTVVTTGQVRFAPGTTVATITVNILNDSLNEPGADETIELQLLDPQFDRAILGSTRRHTLQIVDDDISQAYISSVSDKAPWENEGTVTYTVNLTNPSTGTITVPITISGGGDKVTGLATNGTDFSASAAAIVFNPGTTSIVRTITLTNDHSNEPSEKIEVTLGNPVGDARLSRLPNKPITRSIVIQDNDPVVTIRTADLNIKETEGDFNFVVELSAPTNVAVNVPLIWGGTALRGTDWTIDGGIPTSISIPAGHTKGLVNVNVVNDSLDEPTESVTLKIKEPSGEAKLGESAIASTNIVDTSSAPTVYWTTTGTLRAYESRTDYSMRVKLSKVSGQDIFVDFIIAKDARVELGRDFSVSLIQNKRLAIPAGRDEASFTLNVYEDAVPEPDEGIQFYINDVGNAKLPSESQRSRFFYILDDDSIVIDEAIPTPLSDFAAPGTLAVDATIKGVPLSGPKTSAKPKPSGSIPFNTGNISVTGVSSAGLYSGSKVFFDANLNGVLDFLDLNGNGAEDDGDLVEPSVLTALDGSFSISVPADFDVNGDEELSPSEGRWVMVGGIDTSIGLPALTRLTSPLGQTIITPLSTVVEALMRGEGLAWSEANERVAAGFGLASASFGDAHPVHGALGQDTLATAAERASVKLSSAVIQIARLLVGTPDSPPVDYLADAVYAEVAHRLAQAGAELDLSVQSVVADLISGVSLRTGVLLNVNPAVQAAIAEGAAEVIVAGNQRMDAISNTGELAFLVSLFEIKKVMQLDAAPALQAVTAGTETLGDVVADFTGSNLDNRVAAVTIGQFLPPVLFIRHGKVVEGNNGLHMFELTVELVGDHSLPVSVEYGTEDGSATLADNDYSAVSGAFSWGAGDNTTRTIQIPVNGDSQFEPDEQFFTFLSNATNAVVRRAIGYGFILNDEALDITPVATSNTTLHSLSIDSSRFSLLADNTFIQQGPHADPLKATIRGRDNVDDTFRLDLASNQFRPDVVAFVGGGGTGFDSIEVDGGNFQTITHRLVNRTDGQTLFAAEDQPTLTLNWAGMEPFLMSVGSVEDIIFELPAGVTDAILEDADPTDQIPGLAGKMRLRSTSGGFEETVFASPVGSITIRTVAADGVSILSRDPAFAGQVIIEVLVLNQRPTAVVGGPYATHEGTSITLVGSGSSDDSGIVSYEWDFDYDGATFDVDLASPNPTINHTFGDDFSGTIALRVTDGDGETDIDTASLTITNAAPTATISGLGAIYGSTARATLSSPLDPSPADTAAGFRYVFSIDTDATASATYASGSSSTATADFTGLNAGTHTVYARVIDQDDGFTTYSTEITVAQAQAQINISAYSGTYNASAQNLTGSVAGVAGDLSAQGSSLSFGLSYTDAGQHTGTWTFEGGINYLDDSGTAAIDIAQAPAYLTITPYSGTYDANAHNLTGSVMGVPGDLSAQGSTLAFGLTYTDAGQHTGTWTFEGGLNYLDETGTAAITIAQADASVTINPYSGIYDAVAHNLSGSVTGMAGDPLATGSSLTFGTSYTNAGNHTGAWNFEGGTNYLDESGTAAITIAQASISYTIGNATHVYGSTVNLATALGMTFLTGVNGENLAIAYSSAGNTITANAGQYAITGVVSDGTGLASNYVLAPLTPGALSVTKAKLTGDATAQDALNMAKQGKLSVSVSNLMGLLNGDTLGNFLSTAEYYITVGTNRYAFVPTTVTTSATSFTVAYTLKNSALVDQLAAELADNTSGATAVSAGFAVESVNYLFTDDYFTRLFSTAR